MADVTSSKWYICNSSGEREGPFSTTQIVDMRQSGGIGGDTLCWREGMDDWMPFDQLPSLVAVMNS